MRTTLSDAKTKIDSGWLFNNIMDKFKLPTDRSLYDGQYYSNGRKGKPDWSDFTQAEIMYSIYTGQNCLVILPTGTGKTVCYQGPALYRPGITLVVSPLVALIEDQVDKFNRHMINIDGRDIRAIYPGMNNSSMTDFFDGLSVSDEHNKPLYKLVYVSPERLASPKFRRMLLDYEEDHFKISTLVIDEAHCLSQSSLDFRDSYFEIPEFIKSHSHMSVCAFTATATQFDIDIIEQLLGFNGKDRKASYRCYISIRPRENLIIKPIIKCADEDSDKTPVLTKERNTRADELIKILRNKYYRHRRTLIFCSTKEQVDEVYKFLVSIEWIESARLHKYHASMSRYARQKNLRDFENNKYTGQIMVATNAFGMGVDIPYITLVIHYDIPLTLEGYLQEIGRGARSEGSKVSSPAACFLFVAQGSTMAKGTLAFTNRWIYQSTRLASLQSKEIVSRMELKNQAYIEELARKRYAKVMHYIKAFTDPDNKNRYPQQYILSLLKHNEQKSKEIKTREFLDDLSSAIEEVNELHIGNCALINKLRYGDFTMNKESALSLSEWSRQKTKNRKYHTLIKTDIDTDSAFVVVCGIGTDDEIDYKNTLRKINKAWASRDPKQAGNATRLFLVSDSNKLIIREIFTLSKNKWILDNSYAKRDRLIEVPTSVNGLLNKSRFPEWRNFVKREHKNDPRSGVGPFVYLPGRRKLEAEFKLIGEKSNKPDYFDMCVADAIYSIQQKDKSTRIYTKTIWEILTGDRNIKFSRIGKGIEKEITDSIALLSSLRITIRDHRNDFCIKEEPLLKLSDCQPQKGYIFDDISPLYRYAETLNGEINRVPVSLFGLHLHQISKMQAIYPKLADLKFGLLPILEQSKPINIPLTEHSPDENDSNEENEKATFYPKISEQSFMSNDKKEIDFVWPEKQHFRRLSSITDFTVYLIENKIGEKHPIPIPAQSRPWQVTKENSMLCHYLLHRISISRGRHRCDFINFDNMLSILSPFLTIGTQKIRERFCRKVLAILSYYRNIGYAKYVAYITGFPYKTVKCRNASKNNRQSTAKGTAYFDVSYAPGVTFWRTESTGFIQFQDFRLTLKDPENRFDRNKAMNPGISDLTGIRLLHQKEE